MFNMELNDMEAPTANRWLSVDEIASYLGVKRDTVYKWIDRRKLPAHKMGRLWKFKILEVDPWVKTGGASDSPDSSERSATNK